MRLCSSALDRLPPEVATPAYDRERQTCGIVHFGIGAFHRAHQAVFTDDAMAAGDRDWGIVGVSLRSADAHDQLQPQDGLYSVVERSAGGSAIRIVGAVRSVIVAPRDPRAVIDAVAAATTHIVSFTITEKGYCRRPDGALDLTAADIAHDLRGDGAPRTIFGFLAKGLARRREAGGSGLTLLSCDNLSANGRNLQELLETFLGQIDAGLADWFRAHCRCPSTMVDRIVPATTGSDRAGVETMLGLRDEAVVVTEPFRQWIIEDRFAGPRPRWEVGGARFVADVHPYEVAKLRLLNGAHSALAYLGLLRGHEYVHQAIDDAAIRPVVERLMREEASRSLSPDTGIDTSTYTDLLLARFENDALPHRLLQIAMDGSQKIPQRWLEPIAINRAAGRECPALFAALAAWVLYIRGDTGPVDDPMANTLAASWRTANVDTVIMGLFGERGLFRGRWPASPEDRQMLAKRVTDLMRRREAAE